MFNSHTDQQKKKKAFSKRYIASAWKRQRIVEQNDLPAEFRFAKESSDGVWRGIRWDNRSQTVEKLASDNGLPERAYECGNDGNDRQNNVQAGEKKSWARKDSICTSGVNAVNLKKWWYDASSAQVNLLLRRALRGYRKGNVFDYQALNVQKPRDRITGLRYSNSSQIPARNRRCNPILAGLASLVTTSLIPFNDIKIISAP